MASLDFIRNLLSREQEQGQNYPELPLIQVNEQGGLETDPVKMAQAQLSLKQASTPLTTTDRLFGRDITQDYQTINPETGQAQMATLTNHKPGFFEDFGRGFQENATQGFNVNNLAPVQGKGLATRLGEGLGTLARFYDKPIGRMAVATGLSMLTDEANPLNEGVKAYVGRQNNMTRDKAYRQSLINMGVDEAQVNAIPGIMSDDVYKNMIDALNAQEMRKYRELYLTNQQEQNKIMNQFRQDQLKAQERERAAERADKAATRALTARGQNLNYDIAMRKLEAEANKETAAERKEKAKLKQAQNTINMISKAKETVQNNPNAFGYAQGVLGADVSNRLFKGGTQARSTINSVAAEYRKYLTGAQMSDKERLDYEKFLPSPKDNARILNDKLNAMLDVISAREGIETTSRGVTNVGNYKVRVKQ